MRRPRHRLPATNTVGTLWGFEPPGSNNSGLITAVDNPIEMDNPARMIVLRDSDATTPVAQKDLALVRLSVATAGFTPEELNNST
ncbi:MAG: hypothetical protein K2Y37_13425, partial [Pirellulales bacterium]|nr:hypothetical protein [Pirellulales bacterium]